MTTEEHIVIAYARALDELEKAECSEQSIGAAIYCILLEKGHPETESCLAAVHIASTTRDKFARAYWSAQNMTGKFIALTSAVSVSEQLIRKDIFDESVRRKTAEELAKAKANPSTSRRLPFDL